MKTVRLIAGSQDMEILDLPENFSTEDLAEMIGCDWIEITRPMRLPRNLVVIVDEEGMLKPNYLNPIASFLYGADKHGTPIAGNALVMKEVMGDDGPELAGMDTKEALDFVMKQEWRNAK